MPLLAPFAGALVLDAGCGTGAYALPLAQLGARVIGLDPSREMLVWLRQKEGRLPLVQGRAEALPFSNGSFSRVLSVTILEFLPNPHQALQEMWRVLQPGGYLVLGLLNRHSLWFLIRRLRGKSTPGCHPFTSSEALSILRPLGPIRWQPCIFFPPFPSWLPLLRTWEALGRWLFRPFGAFLAIQVAKPL